MSKADIVPPPPNHSTRDDGAVIASRYDRLVVMATFKCRWLPRCATVPSCNCKLADGNPVLLQQLPLPRKLAANASLTDEAPGYYLQYAERILGFQAAIGHSLSPIARAQIIYLSTHTWTERRMQLTEYSSPSERHSPCPASTTRRRWQAACLSVSSPH